MSPTRPELAPESDAAPASDEGRTVLDARDVTRALTRISHEILERNRGSSDLVLLGIPTRGVHLAQRAALPGQRCELQRPFPLGLLQRPPKGQVQRQLALWHGRIRTHRSHGGTDLELLHTHVDP